MCIYYSLSKLEVVGYSSKEVQLLLQEVAPSQARSKAPLSGGHEGHSECWGDVHQHWLGTICANRAAERFLVARGNTK